MHTQSPRRLTFVSLSFLFAAALLGREPSAQAHALWTDPMPRDGEDGYKPTQSPGFVLPCGVARQPTQPMNTAAAGSPKTVRFTETVAHPGCFLIDFAKSDAGPFERLAVVKRTNARMFTAAITFPNEPCTNCILRLRQFMLANDAATCPPATINDMSNTLYYSCANYTLTGGVAGDGGATEGGVADAPAADVARDTGGGTGGSAGSGGSSGSGGSGGTTTGTGGSTGSGGSSTGTGGSSTGTGGSSTGTGGSSAGTGGTTGGGNTGGGGCAVAVVSPTTGAPLAFLLIGLLALGRGRRRR